MNQNILGWGGEVAGNVACAAGGGLSFVTGGEFSLDGEFDLGESGASEGKFVESSDETGATGLS